MTTKLALAIAALTTIGNTAHSAVNKEPSKLCKTDSGSCSYVCGYFDQSGCTLIKGSCNPNVAVQLYHEIGRVNYTLAILTQQPESTSPSMTMYCKDLVSPPPYNPETTDQRLRRLFGKSVGKSANKHVGKKSRK